MAPLNRCSAAPNYNSTVYTVQFKRVKKTSKFSVGDRNYHANLCSGCKPAVSSIRSRSCNSKWTVCQQGASLSVGQRSHHVLMIGDGDRCSGYTGRSGTCHGNIKTHSLYAIRLWTDSQCKRCGNGAEQTKRAALSWIRCIIYAQPHCRKCKFDQQLATICNNLETVRNNSLIKSLIESYIWAFDWYRHALFAGVQGVRHPDAECDRFWPHTNC